MPFDRNSDNAMFATIIARLDQQNEISEAYRKEVRVSLQNITEQVTATNGQVRDLRAWQAVAKEELAEHADAVLSLNGWRTTVKGRVAGIAMVVSGVVVIIGLVLQALLIK